MAGTCGFVKYWLEMTATSHRKLLWWFYVLQNDWNHADKKDKREKKQVYVLTTQLAFTVLGQKYHAFQNSNTIWFWAITVSSLYSFH